MKIVVTSTGESLESNVDERFGRARYYIIYDTDTRGYETVDNSEVMNSPQGAGVQAATNVASYGADVLITGHCGPKAFQALSAADIKIVTGVSGSVGDVIEDYVKGGYQNSESPDVEGHWS